MRSPETVTGPRLYRSNGVEIDQETADPCVAIIETGSGFGLLLAESASDAEVGTMLLLENVRWGRAIPARGFFSRLLGNRGKLAERGMTGVEIYRHELGPFVVRDRETGLYLPQPSDDPYVVVFLTQEEYRVLEGRLIDHEVKALLGNMEVILEGVPELTVEGGALIGPTSYARGVRVELDAPFLSLGN